jgi:hypothetical protein
MRDPEKITDPECPKGLDPGSWTQALLAEIFLPIAALDDYMWAVTHHALLAQTEESNWSIICTQRAPMYIGSSEDAHPFEDVSRTRIENLALFSSII